MLIMSKLKILLNRGRFVTDYVHACSKIWANGVIAVPAASRVNTMLIETFEESRRLATGFNSEAVELKR
jgi:hypothetical protein